MEQVREGMHVVGSDGEKIGKVKDLKMGDPEAVTADGQTDPETGGNYAAGMNREKKCPQCSESMRRFIQTEFCAPNELNLVGYVCERWHVGTGNVGYVLVEVRQ